MNSFTTRNLHSNMVLLKVPVILPKVPDTLHLHSNMVLLKDIVESLSLPGRVYLHSNMVLLKESEIIDLIRDSKKFTFQYGSIKGQYKYNLTFKL